jgi:hypothetical protein
MIDDDEFEELQEEYMKLMLEEEELLAVRTFVEALIFVHRALNPSFV